MLVPISCLCICYDTTLLSGAVQRTRYYFDRTSKLYIQAYFACVNVRSSSGFCLLCISGITPPILIFPPAIPISLIGWHPPSTHAQFHMRFTPEFLDELRARLPVSEVVGRRVKLKKAGREFKGLSPFQQEKTPSFTVNDQKQFYHDFSTGKHGNIFDFVMETERSEERRVGKECRSRESPHAE